MRRTTTFLQEAPFAGRVDSGDIGSVRICRIAARAHRSDRLNHMRRDDQLAPFYKLVFQLSGTLHLEQDDRRTIVTPGQWCAYDVSRPYAIANATAVNQRAILLAKDAVPASIGRMIQVGLNTAFPMNGVSHVLSDCLASTLDELDSMPVQPAAALGDSMLELTRLTLMQQLSEHSTMPAQDMLRERIKTHIRRNLSDPELSVEMLSRSLGCSKRYLHKVFSEEGHTLSDFIRDCRLEQCGRDLANPDLADRTISEIAFNWGFNNFSHFSQVFKAKYGVSPRAYRIGRLSRDGRFGLQ